MNKALKQHIDHMNFINELFKRPTIDPDNITDADAQAIFENIDCGLSPENLHCDGEISPAQARAKYQDYMSAVAGLRAMGFEPGPECYEL